MSGSNATMRSTLEDNSLLVSAGQAADDINAAFYTRFPYPQQPYRFDYVEDVNFARKMLNQDLGAWTHALIPPCPRIWIAGCGTNQAIFTALRFPNGSVLGSDLSGRSLELCQKNASALNINNLNLKRESINETSYENEFDYIVCTGVIHHNASPQNTLRRLAAALKPRGVVELMVYNRFHWCLPATFQQVLKILVGRNDDLEFESAMSFAKRLLRSLPVSDTALSTYLSGFRSVPDEVFADALLQPVVHAFTLKSLSDLIQSCGLHIATPCITMYDQASESLSWELEFKDSGLQAQYDALPDMSRWQVTNLLQGEKHPFLWFYLRRDDCGVPRQTAQQLCEGFMDTRFEPATTTKRYYENTVKDGFRLSPKRIGYPSPIQDDLLQSVLRVVDGRIPMRTILERVGVPTKFAIVNAVRIRLATSVYPYLVSTSHA
jgi:SAM-dependent methyltransferase